MSQDRSSSFSDCIEWLNNRSQEGDLSLTDFWGVVVCYIKGVQLEKRTLAKEGQRDKDGATPYPLYSAVERALLDKNAEEEPWFEVSTHQAGFTEPGAFVETALLKQPFQGGKVQMDSRRKPMDMVQLQGICGSAFGDSQINIKYIWGLIKNWFHEHWPVADHDHNPFYGPVFKLLDDFGDMERSYDDLQELKIELHDFCGSHIHSDALTTLVRKTWYKMTEVQKRKYITTILDELNQSLNPSLKMKLKATYSVSWWDASKLLMKALSLVYNWDFGEMPNILYKLRDRRVPLGMCEKDIMHVIDAGLYLNSPYPPLLGKKRDIDLIISFDFSEGDPFETVKKAHQYAERCKVPFPEINLDGTDDDCPKSLYIFEGRDKLTVIHIPLFNIDNCKGHSS
ncbi:cytosolic phospholipase A2 gamma-like isoform X2 [Engraulis encrasicolus]|uniref:cytosolic phospholipase A2 gamma-like isoform X2 n=1 Tax=Engraulis encrasicolus TaxID=184585 RepID=UPI002FD02A8B